MKLSIAQILLTAVTLPLAMVSLMMANPANAEQIGRSNQSIEDDNGTPVTELNLAIPGEQPTSRSSRKNSPTTDSNSPKILPTKQSKKVDSKSRRNSTNPSDSKTASLLTPNSNSNSNSGSKRKIATNSMPPLAGNYLLLVRDPNQGRNDIGNPIYTLEAYVDGRKYQTFKAVSGTATTQNRDRDIANTFAPLPDGLYKISGAILASNTPEVGKTFIPIYPQFETERSDLGIHQDPSFNKRNGHDGTAGCIGLTSVADRDAINSFVSKYQPHNLIVKIAPKI
jgi:hypothetical protein